MRLLGAISLTVFLLLTAFITNAQTDVSHEIVMDIPNVALLSLKSNNNGVVNFATGKSNLARQQIELADRVEQTDVWINYSSIVRSAKLRKVTATVQGNIPEGLSLRVRASGSKGAGAGKLGEPLSWVTLSNSPSDVISDIGSCYTGVGTDNGHLISYALEVTDADKFYSKLKNSQTTLQIIYTLSDDN